MSIINSQPLIGASGQGGYFLSKSLRFRSSASAYLDRTPSSAGNQRTWTISFWTKINPNGNNTAIIANNTSMRFGSTADSNTITVNHRGAGGTNYFLISNSVYRDPSAWYHVVWAVDTTQATESNRSKIYVNGVQVTSFSTANYPPQNQDTSINASGVLHYIGRTSTVYYYDGYLAEYNLIDGQALTPSSFGETSTSTGVWIPKKYTGTYGTNGFYLPFTDVATTSGSNAGLGKDFSGNGNYWTTNNISVTSGSTYDSMNDVPTLTSATTANYCVLNPLITPATTTVVDGNLGMSGYTAYSSATGTVGVSSGKWYYEFIAQANAMSGITGTPNGSYYPGQASNSYAWDSANTTKYNNNSGASYGSATSAGDIVGVAFDLDNGSITFYKNNVSQGTAYTFTPSGTYFPILRNGSSANTSVNFGQRPFAYTPPTGFVALNTFNLPTPTIGATASTQANKYFDVLTWTATGGSSRSLTGLNFQPDFVWGKVRSTTYGHNLFDVLRGAGSLKELNTNQTGAEGVNQSNVYGYVSSFNSNGFTVTAGSDATIPNAYWNQGSNTYVAWNWRANGTGVTNTSGSITSTVSANTTAGFSIVTYTGNGTIGATIGHGLGVAPSMLIVKQRTGGLESWQVYHSVLGATQYLQLNSTGAAASNINRWNNTAPTSTVFTVYNDTINNGNTNTYVAYCFAQVAGYSAFGSYTGNGSSDGPFVFTGFRPRYVLIKASSRIDDWKLIDTARDPYNLSTQKLYPNLSAAENGSSGETASTNTMDILSNGFKLRTSNSGTNNNGDTYIYMAFAESPFKFSNAR